MKFFSHSQSTERGAALIMSVLFLVIASTFIILGIAGPVAKDIRTTRALIDSKKSYLAAEGAAEELALRIIDGQSYDASETLTVNATAVDTTITVVDPYIYIESEGTTRTSVRTIEAIIADGLHEGLDYGVQSDIGGIVLENSSQVIGNVYSNGNVVGAGNMIYGDVVSAGPTGFIDDVHATGTAWARTIQDSYIDENAYGLTSTWFGNTILGTASNTSMYQATSALPLTDGILDMWEDYASSTAVYTGPCPYNMNVDTTIGPLYIPCDVDMNGNPTITLSGAVWIEGDLLIRNSTIIQIDGSEGNRTIPIIVDDRSNRTTGSTITLRNSSHYVGNGDTSYVMLISRNESASLGGSNDAIVLENGGTGKLLLYAGKGEVQIENNTTLSETAAYRMRLRNSSQVIYESGLQNLILTTGEPGAYTFYRIEEIE